jgi:hypothetical protein
MDNKESSSFALVPSSSVDAARGGLGNLLVLTLPAPLSLLSVVLMHGMKSGPRPHVAG